VIVGLLVQAYRLYSNGSFSFSPSAEKDGAMRSQLTNPHIGGFDSRGEKVFIYSLTILVTYFNTRVDTFHNPRYMMPLMPLFIILFAEATIIVFSRKAVRIAFLSVLLVLLYASETMTIDPVSKGIYSTFQFGDRSLLCMTHFSNECGQVNGRDQLMYNFEMLQLGSLTDDIISTIGYDKTFAMNSFTNSFVNTNDICVFDKATGRRTADERIGTQVNCINEVFTGFDGLGEFYFIDYPNVNSSRIKDGFRDKFTATKNIRFERDGYAINVIRYERRY
jgi:hypothetical protein